MNPARNLSYAARVRLISIVAGALVILLVAGCGHSAHPIKSTHLVLEPKVVSDITPPVVSLQIQPVTLKAAGDQTVTTWMATYGSGSKKTRFKLELSQGKMHRSPTQEKKVGLPDFESGTGAFIHVSGSNSAGLIQALANVLQTTSVPSHLQKRSRLPFTYVVLGENQSRAPDGSFTDSPSGSWRTMKFFLGNDEGELFFNMNPQSGQAEFTENDPDTSDYDIKQLASVL